jgi:hypothetical protein
MWQQSHRQSELRVTHQGAPLVLGLALHRMAFPAGPDIYAVGGGLVLGARHPILSWLFVELDATLGLQRSWYRIFIDVYPQGDVYRQGMFHVTNSRPLETYARLSAGLALRVASWLDIPMRVTWHMHPVGKSHSLGAASVGLRCRLP